MLKLFFLGLLFSINVYFSGDNNSIINNFSCSICNSSNNLNLARIFYNNNNDNCSCSDCSLNNSNNNNFSCSDCSLNNSNNNNCLCSNCNSSYIYAMHSSSSCIYCLIEKEENMKEENIKQEDMKEENIKQEDMKKEFLIKKVKITNTNASKDIFNNNNKLNNIIPKVQKSIINIYDNNELNNFVRNILNKKNKDNNKNNNKDNEIINITEELEDIDMKNEKSVYSFKE